MPKKGGKKQTTEVKEIPKESGAEQLARLRAATEPHHKADSQFYLAVGAVALIVAIFWGYAMYNQLTMFEIKKTPEKKLMDENKKTWKEIFETVGGPERTEEIKTKLQTILSELKKEATEQNTTTTIATTTLENTTTTTPNNP